MAFALRLLTVRTLTPSFEAIWSLSMLQIQSNWDLLIIRQCLAHIHERQESRFFQKKARVDKRGDPRELFCPDIGNNRSTVGGILRIWY